MHNWLSAFSILEFIPAVYKKSIFFYLLFLSLCQCNSMPFSIPSFLSWSIPHLFTSIFYLFFLNVILACFCQSHVLCLSLFQSTPVCFVLSEPITLLIPLVYTRLFLVCPRQSFLSFCQYNDIYIDFII